MSCQSPENGAIITDNVHKATQQDVDMAVGVARRAFKSWSCTTPAVRSQCLLKFADLLEEHADQLALLEAACTGKPLQLFNGFESRVATSVFKCD